MIEVAKFQIMAFMVILGLVLSVRLMNGKIGTKSVLSESNESSVAGSRVQLLLATILGAAFYVFSMIETPSDTLPDAPAVLLAVIGVSNLGYLGKKAFVRFTQ